MYFANEVKVVVPLLLRLLLPPKIKTLFLLFIIKHTSYLSSRFVKHFVFSPAFCADMNLLFDNGLPLIMGTNRVIILLHATFFFFSFFLMIMHFLQGIFVLRVKRKWNAAQCNSQGNLYEMLLMMMMFMLFMYHSLGQYYTDNLIYFFCW